MKKHIIKVVKDGIELCIKAGLNGENINSPDARFFLYAI